jgi:ABC-type branched-subunit amino acid transport system substrate-binding protein
MVTKKNIKTLIVILVVGIIASFMVGCGGGKKEIIIGAPMPLTGPFASDGEQMKMALELAVAEKKIGRAHV